MEEWIRLLFDANFEAHGSHFAETPILFGFLIAGNLVTALSYYGIPAVLLFFVAKRKDLAFHWMFLLFGAFIFLCATHHFVHIVTYWYPVYRLQAVVDNLMGLVSLATLIALIWIIPAALAIPSQAQLNENNRRLAKEIRDRKRAERDLQKGKEAVETSNAELEKQNAELERVNRLMVGRELKMAEMKEHLKRLESRKDGT